MRRVVSGGLALPLFLALFSPALGAAEADEDELETLVISSPAGDWSAAGSVFQLGAAALAERNAQHAHDVFVNLPGAWVSRGSGQENLTALRSPVLTGPGACGAFLVLEEGVPIRPAGFCNVNNMFETTLELATGVQAALGPAAVVYGGNALHGAIDLSFELPSAERANYLQLGAGPWGYRTATWGWRSEPGSGDAQLGVFLAEDGGWRHDSGYGLRKLRFSRRSADASLRWSLSAVGLEQETAGYIVGEDRYRAADHVRRANEDPEAFRDASALRLVLHGHGGGADATSDWRAWARASDMEFLLHFLPCKPLERNDHQSFGGSWQQRRQSEGSEWTWGLRAEFAQVHLDQYQQRAPADCDTRNAERFSQGWHYDYDVASSNFAAWSGGRHRLNAAGDASLLWDLRLEQLDYDYDSRLPPGPADNDGTGCGGTLCRYSRPPDGTDRFSPLGTRLALSFAPPGWRWHLSLATGYRPPQIGELYRLQERQRTADLESEILSQLEWGGQWATERTELQWAIYTAAKENFIFRDSTRAIRASGATEHLGLEVLLRSRPAEAHDLELSLSLAEHNYDFSWEDTVVKGNRVDTAPGEMAALTWRWRPGGASGMRLAVEWLHTGDYYTDPDNEHSYPGHDLLNLRLSLSPLPPLSLQFRLHNAFDEPYADRADYTDFGGDRYFPGRPRALYLSARWNFPG